MNLSARLDQARKEREMGLAPDLGRDKTDLRFKDEDGQAYDGQELRTGSPLTPQRWEAVRNRREGNELPNWNPHRANETNRVFGDDDIIDLRDPPPTSALPPHESSEGFRMPAWAPDGTAVYQAPTEGPALPATDTCPRCGGPARVEVVDLKGNGAQLGCDACNIIWDVETTRANSGLF
jgi:hypothetical protein